MQLSRHADYAVRAMLDVATHADKGRVTVAEIARRQLVPVSFLRRIVAQLAAGGLLETQRGERGGIVLARPAENITLLEIIEIADGPIFLNRCLTRPGECPLDRRCPVHEVWCEAQRDLTNRLASARLSDLVRRAAALHQVHEGALR